MKTKISFAHRASVFFIGLFLALSGPTAETAHAEDAPLARQIAERMVSEESFIALMVASMDEVRQKTRDGLSKIVDVSSISDNDLTVFLRVSTDINAKATVAGLRRAIANKLEEISKNDQKIFLECMKNFTCKRDELSADALTFIREMPAFGKSKGEEIGRAVGERTLGRVLEKLKSMDESKFDDRDELIRIMSLPTFKT